MVRTSPFQGGNTDSNSVGVTNYKGTIYDKENCNFIFYNFSFDC